MICRQSGSISFNSDGERRPNRGTLYGLAQALGVKEEELYRAGGLKMPAGATREQENFYLWLSGKNPSPRDLRVIKAMAEAYMAENEPPDWDGDDENQGTGSRGGIFKQTGQGF